ncbi:MAG: DEAD/DEAH box helicase [Desulfobacterales bacterium]
MPTSSQRIEYYRHAVALIPEPGNPDPGPAIWVSREKSAAGSMNCNCRAYKENRTCAHVQELSKMIPEIGSAPDFDTPFRQSTWYELAVALHEAHRVEPRNLQVLNQNGADGDREVLCLAPPAGGWQIAYFPDHRVSDGSITEQDLLLQRCDLHPEEADALHRGRILGMLARMTLTESEEEMAYAGFQTRRQAFEAGFWYRFAYHCYRLSGDAGVMLKAESNEKDGSIAIRCLYNSQPMFDLTLPRDRAHRVISKLGWHLENRDDFQLYPEALASIAWVTADAEHNLIITLYFRLTLPDGGTELIERKKLSKFWYKDTVYFPEKGFFATVKKPDPLWEKFGGKYRKKIKKHRVPEVLDRIGTDLFRPPHIVDESVKQMQVHTVCHSIDLSPEALDRDWCWLSIDYGFGADAKVSLAELYQAKKTGKRFLPVSNGCVDTRAFNLDNLTGQPGNPILDQLENPADALKLSRLDLFRLKASTDADLTVSGGDSAESRELADILELKPPAAYSKPAGMASDLRNYQKVGTEWLLFLYENRFGGLLCDDMGLGKTHQVMALMAWLLENRGESDPFLVVCPTSVISHWERKISEHAPGLTPMLYHGAARELDGMELPGRVLITSYGILYRDIAELSGYRFAMAAFDEAQAIKNPATKSYAAAQAINARIKLGVTGTPIENRLSELKALMDLCLPGYLGADEAFEPRYGNLDGRGHAKRRKIELNRIIAPFTLRRLKSSVLTELPEKIEDIRYCRLTGTQVRLYREAVNDRGGGLVSSLEKADADIPYIHIFALLTLLKQICDHPAIIDPDRFQTGKLPLDSGKWELFKELLSNCLETGQKVVVYSQFVAMIRMIESYLKDNGIDGVSLTGATRNRKQVIDRFNEDPACRVFVGSLKAGGTGIDLTAGSVVIHYDRWWNAAKEDQATDRVHRIGQKRGVQVFKLVTEGTLEEKISAIIARKKHLMADIVKEDDPGVLKTFSRNELMDLLTVPDSNF